MKFNEELERLLDNYAEATEELHTLDITDKTFEITAATKEIASLSKTISEMEQIEIDKTSKYTEEQNRGKEGKKETSEFIARIRELQNALDKFTARKNLLENQQEEVRNNIEYKKQLEEEILPGIIEGMKNLKIQADALTKKKINELKNQIDLIKKWQSIGINKGSVGNIQTLNGEFNYEESIAKLNAQISELEKEMKEYSNQEKEALREAYKMKGNPELAIARAQSAKAEELKQASEKARQAEEELGDEASKKMNEHAVKSAEEAAKTEAGREKTSKAIRSVLEDHDKLFKLAKRLDELADNVVSFAAISPDELNVASTNSVIEGMSHEAYGISRAIDSILYDENIRIEEYEYQKKQGKDVEQELSNSQNVIKFFTALKNLVDFSKGILDDKAQAKVEKNKLVENLRKCAKIIRKCNKGMNFDVDKILEKIMPKEEQTEKANEQLVNEFMVNIASIATDIQDLSDDELATLNANVSAKLNTVGFDVKNYINSVKSIPDNAITPEIVEQSKIINEEVKNIKEQKQKNAQPVENPEQKTNEVDLSRALKITKARQVDTEKFSDAYNKMLKHSNGKQIGRVIFGVAIESLAIAAAINLPIVGVGSMLICSTTVGLLPLYAALAKKFMYKRTTKKLEKVAAIANKLEAANGADFGLTFEFDKETGRPRFVLNGEGFNGREVTEQDISDMKEKLIEERKDKSGKVLSVKGFDLNEELNKQFKHRLGNINDLKFVGIGTDRLEELYARYGGIKLAKDKAQEDEALDEVVGETVDETKKNGFANIAEFVKGKIAGLKDRIAKKQKENEPVVDPDRVSSSNEFDVESLVSAERFTTLIQVVIDEFINKYGMTELINADELITQFGVSDEEAKKYNDTIVELVSISKNYKTVGHMMMPDVRKKFDDANAMLSAAIEANNRVDAQGMSK